jgi:arylsulfatase A-like enzyme
MLVRLLIFAAFSAAFASAEVSAADRKPNVVVVFCDDLGYGDLGCFGHPTIRTPNLDRMAREGMRLTQFYAAACVCTPSRAALMTGRLPIRSGMCSDKRRVLFPNSGGGMPAKEVTLAEAMKAEGYATACIGKWHLGHLPQFLPTSNGFDSYFGIPYSNDMDRVVNSFKGREGFWNPKVKYWNVPLMQDEKIIERPADQTTITKRYSDGAIEYIKENRNGPFFLYLAHSLPHVPLFASKKFQGTSPRGLFGDVIEEIDDGVGRILQTLRDLKIDDNTIVWFTSDNGPWLIFKDHGGSAGLLREGKGSTWEGGMREPTIAWWPGTIPAATVATELGSTMDIYTTSIKLAGGNIPTDRIVDGLDLTALLTGKGPSPRKTMFYYRGTRLMAVRKGAWKVHFTTQPGYGGKSVTHETPLVFNLNVDPSEKYDIAKDHPEVITTINEEVARHREKLVAAPSQLEILLKK